LNENQTTVVIHVNDVNDLPPVFTSNLYTAVMEEEFAGPHPYSLLQVQCLLVAGCGVIHSSWE
jgi:hypothetical protein